MVSLIPFDNKKIIAIVTVKIKMEGHVDEARTTTTLKAGWIDRLSEFFQAEIVDADEDKKKITQLRGELHSTEEKVAKLQRKLHRHRIGRRRLVQENRRLKEAVERHERREKRARPAEIEDDDDSSSSHNNEEEDDEEENPIVLAWEKRWKGEIEQKKNKQKK